MQALEYLIDAATSDFSASLNSAPCHLNVLKVTSSTCARSGASAARALESSCNAELNKSVERRVADMKLHLHHLLHALRRVARFLHNDTTWCRELRCCSCSSSS